MKHHLYKQEYGRLQPLEAKLRAASMGLSRQDMAEAARLSGILVKLNDTLVQYAQVILIGEQSAASFQEEKDQYLKDLEVRQTRPRKSGGELPDGGARQELHGVMVDQ